MLMLEGDEKEIHVTVLEPKGKGYTGLSTTVSKQKIINKLINEGIMEDGETVQYKEEL